MKTLLKLRLLILEERNAASPGGALRVRERCLPRTTRYAAEGGGEPVTPGPRFPGDSHGLREAQTNREPLRKKKRTDNKKKLICLRNCKKRRGEPESSREERRDELWRVE